MIRKSRNILTPFIISGKRVNFETSKNDISFSETSASLVEKILFSKFEKLKSSEEFSHFRLAKLLV